MTTKEILENMRKVIASHAPWGLSLHDEMVKAHQPQPSPPAPPVLVKPVEGEHT
jgi:hypothetical protein